MHLLEEDGMKLSNIEGSSRFAETVTFSIEEHDMLT
jgi:hypothetical protein